MRIEWVDAVGPARAMLGATKAEQEERRTAFRKEMDRHTPPGKKPAPRPSRREQHAINP